METDYDKVNLMFEYLHKYMERIIDIHLRKHEEEQRKKEELCLTNIEEENVGSTLKEND